MLRDASPLPGCMRVGVLTSESYWVNSGGRGTGLRILSLFRTVWGRGLKMVARDIGIIGLGRVALGSVKNSG